MPTTMENLGLGYDASAIGQSLAVNADCFEWMSRVPEGCIHSIVTDPPYGVKEFEDDQLAKLASGKGGIWRVPPSFDGHERSPLPRFTALDPRERERLRCFFRDWAALAVRVLRPGGHVFFTTNAFVSQLVFGALVEGGLEFRGEVIRLVRTLRGGDRPKNAEGEFPNVSSMARGCYEPWGVLRRPLPSKMTVAECLRTYETGGLRRYANGLPFEDVIVSERTPQREREVAAHPSIKPQSLMRRLVWASLPLGEGIVLDPFMGSGSTIAAAESVGYRAIGIERYREYYDLGVRGALRLRSVRVPEVDSLVDSVSDPLLLPGNL